MVFKAIGNFTLPSQEQAQNGTHTAKWKEIKQLSEKGWSKKKVMLGNQPMAVPGADVLGLAPRG
ncbi:unnamed protein product [Prunus armeniaca]